MNIRISEEVKEALALNKPVVALESTIISHGMPYPINVEKIVRENGAVPATIGIIDGVGIIGMNKNEIEEFGKRKGIVKVSRRDLPVVFAKKMWGATTVATTMILAKMANIDVFVTGGIGGVHRGAQDSFDISADLQELAHTDVTVVCAGAKAILDLPLTLEYLETFGVPVLGYKTKELPAFYTRHSGLNLDYEMNNEKEIAEVIKMKKDLKLQGGILVTVPINEEDSLDPKIMNEAIDKALIEAKNKGVKGKDTTPFLLSRIKDITNNESLESNISLIYNNAKIGALIAKELSLIK